MSIEALAENAAKERLWSHAVGIENRALVTRGTDPATALRTTELSSPGTAVAGVWGKNYFVLTAKHVLEQARIDDLRFFVRQAGELKTKLVSEITMSDAVVAAPIGNSEAAMHRCEWEDLAVLSVTAEALGSNLEFFNFDRNGSWVDPGRGERVAGIGYPVGAGALFQQRVGNALKKAVLLTPIAFSAEVMPRRSKDDLPFKFPSCNPATHYLIPFEPAKTGIRPEGISGAAIWVPSSKHHALWAPRFRFAGICTSCYRSGTIEQIVKASVVRKFLTEVFGLPKKPRRRKVLGRSAARKRKSRAGPQSRLKK